MKSKIFKTILSLSVVTSVLVGCNSSDTASTGETPEAPKTETTEPAADTKAEKITVWAWDPNFNIDIMNKAAARYGTDVEIEIVEMSKDEVEQLLHTNLASGVKEGLPDIVLIEDYNAQKYLLSYPGAFADLTNEFDYSEFADYKVAVSTVEDKIYSVPFDSGVAGFFYRADLLEQAGYTSTDLQNITWADSIEIGKDVKEKTGEKLLAFGRNDGGLIRIMLQSAGSWYFDENGEVNMADNAALIEALDTYKAIIDADIAVQTNGWTEWVSAFNTGKAASVTTGAWIIGSVKAGEDQSGKWALAPIPHLTSVESKASNLGGSSWYVLDTENKATAIDFLSKTFASDLDFYQQILVENGAVGTYLPAQTGAAYSEADEFFGGQAVFTDLSSYMKEIPSVNYGLYTYEADGAIMALIEDLYSGKITSKELCEQAESALKVQIN